MDKPVNKKVRNAAVIVILFFLLPVIVIIGIIWMEFISDVVDDIKYEFADNKELKEIMFSVPDTFDDDSNQYNVSYKYHGNDVNCYIYVYEDDKWKDFEYWFKGRMHFDLNDEISEVKNVDINSNNALYTKKINQYELEQYYGFESTNYYYLLTYSIRDYNHGDSVENNECYAALDKVLSSIEIK